jgi:hypothetical protein
MKAIGTRMETKSRMLVADPSFQGKSKDAGKKGIRYGTCFEFKQKRQEGIIRHDGKLTKGSERPCFQEHSN